ncbi:MAG TPA: hypothetical protein VK470_14060, partial [Bacteroidota bacterium]|nr:hypothetical protein [Bacteroidota bacterium]
DDTLRVERNGKTLGTIKVTAVSRQSSAAVTLTQAVPFVVGDAAVILKLAAADSQSGMTSVLKDTTVIPGPVQIVQPASTQSSPPSNIVSGRVGLQYSGISADDRRMNYSQPSALFRVDVGNVLGTGMTFTLYSRNFYDLSDSYARYGETSRLKHRVYELSLQRDTPDDAIGYGVGRMISRYVGGLGVFDGGHFYLRQSNFTLGGILGANIGDRTMGFEGRDQKGAVFLNYRSGRDFMHQYDGTVAYVRQHAEGRLDREFVYVQNSLSMGSAFSVYESMEIDLNDINRGVRSSAARISNTFLSLNYYPVQWFSMNAGYDASRSVYLFETMKTFPDTLFDRSLTQGFRGSANFRLPYYITLALNGSLRTRQGDERNSHNLGASLRMSDIAGSEIEAAVRYANIVGVYTDGNNITVDLDRTFFNRVSISMRYDYYAFRVISLDRSFITQTLTVNANYRMSRWLYSTVSVDRVIDATMNSYRIYGEIGVRF